MPSISARKDAVVREKLMRSATSSSLSPSSSEAMARPRGAVEVEPSSRGKVSRVRAMGCAEGWGDSGCTDWDGAAEGWTEGEEEGWPPEGEQAAREHIRHRAAMRAAGVFLRIKRPPYVSCFIFRRSREKFVPPVSP